MDNIKMDRMEFYGYHGCLAEENRLGQKFLVDLELGLDLRRAGQTDELDKTINYAEVFAETKKIVEGEPVKLIECLAEKIASMILTKFLLAENVKVTIHKPGAPIAGAFRDVSVTVERSSYYCYLGLGSNIGNKAEYILKAMDLLKKNPNIYSLESSSFYETPPWGKTDQPPFINSVAKVKCGCELHELLEICQSAELELGRERKEHWGPRTIDIDLLCTDKMASCDDELLKLPHPYMLERAFVLVPLAELSPELKIKGMAVKAHLAKLNDRDTIVKLND